MKTINLENYQKSSLVYNRDKKYPNFESKEFYQKYADKINFHLLYDHKIQSQISDS
jgi:hypothetical protein